MRIIGRKEGLAVTKLSFIFRESIFKKPTLWRHNLRVMICTHLKQAIH